MQEIVDKWYAIDDEIWAKIICMERNRRIAKAYARNCQITVDGSEDEYLDGTKLGLNSFNNPTMDSKTRQIKQYIGQVGCFLTRSIPSLDSGSGYSLVEDMRIGSDYSV